MDSMYLSITFQSIDFTQKPFAVIKNFLIERETKKRDYAFFFFFPRLSFPESIVLFTFFSSDFVLPIYIYI